MGTGSAQWCGDGRSMKMEWGVVVMLGWMLENGDRTLIVALQFCLPVPSHRVVTATAGITAGSPISLGRTSCVGPG
jgi:hypothetical protein